MHAILIGAGALCIVLAGVGGRLSVVTIKRVSLAILALFAVAVIRLAAAFVSTDTSFVVVNEASRRATSTMLRVAGLWGTARSSLLMWTLCAACVLLFVSRSPASDAVIYGRRVRACAAVVAAFALLSALIANPFLRDPLPPIDGAGLSPILEHPAMLWHPPLMYAGLVSTMVAWVSAVFTGEADRVVTTVRLRRSLLSVVLLLGVALLLGALWAYEEQGWGGYWAWDPVENGGFLPWLSALSALHALRARGITRTVRLLITLTFFLTCLGSLTTRSGILPSVHAFAEQRTLGVALAGVSLAVAVGSLWWIFRERISTPSVTTDVRTDNVARFASPLIGSAIGIGVVAIVTLGTYAPLFRYLRDGTRTQTLGTYFSRFVFPLAIIATVALATSRFGRDRAKELVTIGTLATITTYLYGFRFSPNVGSLLLFWCAMALIPAVTWAAIRRRWSIANALAHGGFGLLLLGFAGSMATTHRTLIIPQNASRTVGTLKIGNTGVTVNPLSDSADSKTTTVRAHITVDDHGNRYTLEPALVGFPGRGVIFAKTAIQRGILNDVHLSLQRATDSQIATIELHDRPLTTFVWLGAACMQLGVLMLGLRSIRRPRKN